ncbi:GFA family protein [soil metagenome]
MQGGCLCGRIRYRITAAPLATMVCHCDHCRKQSGSAFSVNLVVADDAFEVVGQESVFEDVGESGLPVHRHFCSGCGSPIRSLLDAMPGVSAVKAGTLDDGSSLQPQLQIYGSRRQAWLDDVADIPVVPGAPPAP